MEWYWEVIGYTGTALVILSMTMTSVTRLRVLNICGSVLSTVYAVLGEAWPIVIMNTCLICINVFHLVRDLVRKKAFAHVRLKADDPAAGYFLSAYEKDIEKYFPEYTLTPTRDTELHMVCLGRETVGLLVGVATEDCFSIEMSYVIPKYRDAAMERFLFPTLKKEGVNRLTAPQGTDAHKRCMKQLGFVNDGGVLRKEL